MVFVAIFGAVTGGFVVWCIMDSLDDVRWWKEHGGD